MGSKPFFAAGLRRKELQALRQERFWFPKTADRKYLFARSFVLMLWGHSQARIIQPKQERKAVPTTEAGSTKALRSGPTNFRKPIGPGEDAGPFAFIVDHLRIVRVCSQRVPYAGSY
jgi:hypothetical protein